jgi:hypothetical protein
MKIRTGEAIPNNLFICEITMQPDLAVDRKIGFITIGYRPRSPEY